MVKVESRPEQKQPRQKREVIGGEKAEGVKAQIGCKAVCVQAPRQQPAQCPKAPVAVHRVIGQRKQRKADEKARHRRNLLQGLFQQPGQDHRRAQQGQHTE